MVYGSSVQEGLAERTGKGVSSKCTQTVNHVESETDAVPECNRHPPFSCLEGKPSYALASGSSLSAGADRANQYLLGTLLNGHQPTVVVFAREGSTFADPNTNWKADHGGSGWETQHVPLIMAGPGIQAGSVVNAPAQLEDLAPTLLTDMGVMPTGMEGKVLAEALQGATEGQTNARSAEVKQISPVIHALQVQDKVETLR
jgi:hypothetical protein